MIDVKGLRKRFNLGRKFNSFKRLKSFKYCVYEKVLGLYMPHSTFKYLLWICTKPVMTFYDTYFSLFVHAKRLVVKWTVNMTAYISNFSIILKVVWTKKKVHLTSVNRVKAQ